MPEVEWLDSTLPRGSEAMDFQLFYPICIREDSKEQEEQQYDTEYFKQAIKLIKKRYEGKVIHILLADTLDRYNRCTPEDILITDEQLTVDERTARDERLAAARASAVADGDRWINIHEPILNELGLTKHEPIPNEPGLTEHEPIPNESGLPKNSYIIHRWDEFLSQSKEFLTQFEKTLVRQGTIQAFKNTAKHYRKKTMQDYEILPQGQKELVVDASTKYFVEDYGVTYYISSREKYRPALFFSKNQNKHVVKLFSKCNNLDLNFDGIDGFVYLQLTHDSERGQLEQEPYNNVVNLRGNRSAIFGGGGSHSGYLVDQESMKRNAKIQGLKARLQALNEVKSDLQRMNNEQISKVDQQITDCLNALFEEINEQQLQTMSGTTLG